MNILDIVPASFFASKIGFPSGRDPYHGDRIIPFLTTHAFSHISPMLAYLS